MIILASKSSIRSQLLTNAGIPHTVLTAPYDEDKAKTDGDTQTPSELSSYLAQGKAFAVSAQHPEKLIIAADQTLDFNGQLINKCQTVPEARQLLQKLRGHTHQLHAATAVVRGSSLLFSHTSTVSLSMRHFSDEFLDAYLQRHAPAILSAVGCYHYEAQGIKLFDAIEGDYHAILGLALLPLLAFLREIGELET